MNPIHRPMMIIDRMRAIQDRFGYLPDCELQKLADALKLEKMDAPLYRLQELASFFPHFRQEWNKPPFVDVKVCRDMSCHRAGAVNVLEGLKTLERGGTKPVIVDGVSCLGRCDRAPVICVSRHVLREADTKRKDWQKKCQDGEKLNFRDYIYAGRSRNNLNQIIAKIIAGDTAEQSDTDATYKIDRADWQIDVYKEGSEFERYAAVRALLTDSAPLNDPHPWLERLKSSGLHGMGGPGLPAHSKWLDVCDAKPAGGANEKYIVCNADESEPATFKDREILLHMPHLVVEGVVLAGLITRATAGYIFIRHEYVEQIASVKAEIENAEKLGACGHNIFGFGRNFPVTVVVSPGGYICGEQSALLEAMEDRRAQPRNRPPELKTNGLYDCPTLVNNVETLAWTPGIMLRGGEWYVSGGTAGFNGRRFFSICGDLKHPGVFEVPIGTTLGELINRAEGMRVGDRPKVVCTSGPSGGFFPSIVPLTDGSRDRLKEKVKSVERELRIAEQNSDKNKEQRLQELQTNKSQLAHIDNLMPDGAAELDLLLVSLDKGVFNFLREILKAPLLLGAGIAVFDESADVPGQALQATEFFRNESCGKCVPCRIGSQKLVNIGLELCGPNRMELTQNQIAIRHKEIEELSQVMDVTSICGLGQVAFNPLSTALKYFAKDCVTLPPPSNPGANHV